MKNNQSLFEQILRIKSLMNESKQYLLNESIGVGLLKAIIKGVDDLVVGAKVSDDLLDAAKAVAKATDEATAILKIRSFMIDAINSGKGNLVSELAENTIKNMDPTSTKNIDDLEEAFIQSAVADGKVGLDELEQLRQTVRANLKVDTQLADLAANIEAKIMSRIKKAAEDAIAGGGSSAGKVIDFMGETFDSVLARANDVLKLEVPPKSITREILESSVKAADNVEKLYNAGKITADELFSNCLKYGKVIEDNFTKMEKIFGPIMKYWKAFWKALGENLASFLKWITNNKWKVLGGMIFVIIAGGIGIGAYSMGDYFGFTGVGKAQKCFGDDVTVKCVETIPGYRALDSTQVEKLCKIDTLPQKSGSGKLSCDNIAEDSPENIKVKSITYEDTGGTPGKVNKFIFKFGDGKTKTYNADTGAELGGGGGGGTVTPPPSTCVWADEAAAKAALKGTFPSATDADITVNLTNCKVTYKNPILNTTKEYGPDDL